MKRLLFIVLTFFVVTVTSFSQVNKSVITDYMTKDGSVYFIGDKLTIGVPSSNSTFTFVTNKTQTLVTGEKIEIQSFYVKDSVVMIVGISNKIEYNIPLQTAIETGEIESHEVTQKKNDE